MSVGIGATTDDAVATALELLRRMKKIRHAEEEIARRYSEGKMRCPTHLCIGQEAVAAGLGLALRPTDLAVSTHRAHGHYLGKGGDLNAMIAEIYGKATGCAKGNGGSMHLVDTRAGFVGSTAIVGSTVPIAVGLGLSIALHNTDQVSCVFLGEAATEEGVFYESVNFAVLKKLPVLFVCENNLYSVYSPLRVRQPEGRRIFEMVAAMGCTASHGDGNNAIDVYERSQRAIDSIRRGQGPVFFEFSTYRWREHCGPNYDNDIGYRTEEEFEFWKKKDPIAALEAQLVGEAIASKADLAAIDEGIFAEVREAFDFAERSPFPEQSDSWMHLFDGCAG